MLCWHERFAVTLPLQRSVKAEFVDTVNLVIGDAGEDVGEPGLRIDAIELGRLDQAIGDGS